MDSLNATEIRVLGSLLEKETTTPDYYPLSLHALITACNQKSNRDPVMELDEDAVRQALHGLGDQRLAGPAGGVDSRVPKYEHRLESFNFTRGEAAVLCVLLLRGPQTPGELRGRAERMHRFEELSDVQTSLQKLMQREPPLVKILARQPGMKEARYAHMFGGDVDGWKPASAGAAAAPSPDADRLERLEEQVAGLQKDMAELRQQLSEFRRRFE